MTCDGELEELATRVLSACREKGLMVVSAESCTAGLVAATLTDIAGSSDVVERGFVTYTNRAKREMLDVPETLLTTFGAVSTPVARAMAQGALGHSVAQISVAITGVAGPGGGSIEKPVGLVHFATARLGRDVRDIHRLFKGDRASVRRAATRVALELILERAEEVL